MSGAGGRIAVVFFGLARGLPITGASIREHVVACNAGSGFAMSTIASINLVGVVDNPRGGERGIRLDPSEVFLLEADIYSLVRQDDAAIAEALAAARRQPDVFENDWSSVRNLLHQLAALRRAWQLCQGIGEGGFEHYLFVRPDLLYLQDIRLAEILAAFRGDGNIALPAWHSHGGFNDRFAFADATAAACYANRLSLVPEYCETRALHSERLLAYCLDKAACRVSELPVRAKRVRAYGAVVDEPFGANVAELPVARAERFVLSSDGVPVFQRESWTMVSAEVAQVPAGEVLAEPPERARAPRRVTQDGFDRLEPLGGPSYLEFLGALHHARDVRRYLEIGTQLGESLKRARFKAVAIDPNFLLDKAAWAAKPGTALFEMTSDAFFAAVDPRDGLGGAIDLAFIDGMHLAEFVLRDFVNVERYCAPGGLIALHDALPMNFEMTERRRRPEARRDRALAGAWTGDVWRVLPLLRRERPDLRIEVLDCQPTGLVLISQLDPGSRRLVDRLDILVPSLTEAEPAEAEFWSYIEALTLVDSRSFA